MSLDKQNVERFGTTVEFSPVKIKRGEFKDQEYLGVEVTKENWRNRAEFLGDEIMSSVLRGKMNGVLQRLFDEACTNVDKTPKPFDLVEWTESVKGWSARGETMESLNEQIEELTDELSNINWGTKGTPENDAANARAMEIAVSIGQLRTAVKDKKRDRQEKKAAPAVA